MYFKIQILGLAGLLPIHPKTIMRARIHRNRMAASPFGRKNDEDIPAEEIEQKKENAA
jgi:hypothetical protein